MERSHSGNMIRLFVIGLLLVFIYQYVLPPPQKQALNQVITDMSRQPSIKVSTAIATAIIVPTRAVVRQPNVGATTVQQTVPIGGTLKPSLPTPLPTALPAVYVECSPGSYYSCEDLDKMRQEAREDVESDMHDAVIATDDFLIVPTTAPAIKQEWVDACNNTPKADRTGFLAAICEGAGL